MPTQTLPLVGTVNTRQNVSNFGKDQLFKACFPIVLKNAATGVASAYCQKRQSFSTVFTPAAGNAGTSVWGSPSTGVCVTAFGKTTSTVYADGASVGSITANHIVRHISETIISGVTMYLISAADRTTSIPSLTTSGWYLASDSYAATAYTADGNNSTTITDIKIAGVNNTAGLYPGQLLTAGANIVAGTRVVSVNSAAFTAVLDTATTGGSFNDLAITKTPIAKMNDADFPTSIVGEFIELSGTIYIMDTSGRIWGSDLNSVSSWTATNFISANLYTDGGVGLAKDGDKVIGFGSNSAEWFYNAGNATGSLLAKTGRSIPIGSVVSLNESRSSPIASAGQFICWIASTGSSGQVWMMNSGAPSKISNAFVEAFIDSNTIRCVASFTYMGCQFVFISGNNGVIDFNLIYSIETGLWGDMGFADAYILSSTPGFLSGPSSFIYAIEAFDTDGIVYRNGSVFQDQGGAIALSVQTAGLDFGTDARKFVENVWLDADTQSSGTATLEASDDDFASWSTLGTFDMTAHEKRISRCGSHKGERAYRLTHSANTAFRAKALRVDYTVGQ